MASYHNSSPGAGAPAQQVQQILQQFAQGPGLPFRGVLTAEDILEQVRKHDANFAQRCGHIWNAVVVLWTWLSQCVAEQKSCQWAVLRAFGLLFSLGQPLKSFNTGAYCKARAKLPEALIRELALTVGRRLEAQAPLDWLWYGRHVYLIDGSTLSMADTQANQKVYPQQRGQKPGLGFPLLRIVVAVSLATGALVAVAWAPYHGKQTGESSLLRKLLDQFQEKDVLVGDKQFCSYWMVALCRKRKLDVVFRQHHLRDSEPHPLRRLGRQDHLVQWVITPKPVWMERDEYQALRKEFRQQPLVMREFTVSVNIPGYRSEKITVATTLEHAGDFPQADVAGLYHDRWSVELDLRSIKCLMRMEPLSCKSPEMVHKEIWMHFLAYNLIRKTIAQSAWQENRLPRRISFNAARGVLVEHRAYLSLYGGSDDYRTYCEALFKCLAQCRVGDRPHRVEPRAIKRRPKPHDYLTRPRREAIAALLSA